MNQILQGDALQVLKTLPDTSVQCCVTSPPYYGLRDYGIPEQIGLETTLDEYVAKLVEIFRQVRRVLRNDGVLWLNLGDSFSDKQLLGIPWRVAFALQTDGWKLRCDVIWEKLNGMTESVQDRPSRVHEYVFLFSKNDTYFYDANAIREPIALSTRERNKYKRVRGAIKGIASGQYHSDEQMPSHHREMECNPLGKNKRSIWSIAIHKYEDAHFATFPPKLVEPCILAGSRPGDIVLDCFIGAGTVALVAIQYNRRYVGIELNPAYVEMINRRIAHVQGNLWASA